MRGRSRLAVWLFRWLAVGNGFVLIGCGDGPCTDTPTRPDGFGTEQSHPLLRRNSLRSGDRLRRRGDAKPYAASGRQFARGLGDPSDGRGQLQHPTLCGEQQGNDRGGGQYDYRTRSVERFSEQFTQGIAGQTAAAHRQGAACRPPNQVRRRRRARHQKGQPRGSFPKTFDRTPNQP